MGILFVVNKSRHISCKCSGLWSLWRRCSWRIDVEICLQYHLLSILVYWPSKFICTACIANHGTIFRVYVWYFPQRFTYAVSWVGGKPGNHLEVRGGVVCIHAVLLKKTLFYHCIITLQINFCFSLMHLQQFTSEYRTYLSLIWYKRYYNSCRDKTQI